MTKKGYEMRKFLTATTLMIATVLLAGWTPTPPPGYLELFSQSYNLTGPCDGGDMVYKWKINGAAGAGGVTTPPVLGPPNAHYPNGSWPAPGTPGSSFIFPFTDGDISIVRATISIIPPAAGYTSQPLNSGAGANYVPAYSWLMIGNNADGDEMLRLDGLQGHWTADVSYPAGTAFQFPGANNMWNMGYIDLHGGCTAGMIANIFLTLYYVKNP